MAIQKIKLKIGTVYQKGPNGVYYFRYQVNGARKAISLKTRNKHRFAYRFSLLKTYCTVDMRSSVALVVAESSSIASKSITQDCS